jgi:hypothetical protein
MKAEENPSSATEATGYIAGVTAGVTRQAMRGKHVSASIIVLAGAMLLLGGSFIRHADTRLFLQVVGCAVGAIGLIGWFFSIQDK